MTEPAGRPDSRRSRRRLTPEQRRDEILDAAGELIREGQSLDSASLERVAERASCSRNLVYRYFSHHDGLVEALTERLLRDVRDGIQGIPNDVSAADWLGHVLGVLLDQAEAHGALLLVLFEHDRGRIDRSRRRMLVAALADRLRGDGMPTRRATVVAPIVGSALIGALAAAVNGSSRRDVEAEFGRVTSALTGSSSPRQRNP